MPPPPDTQLLCRNQLLYLRPSLLSAPAQPREWWHTRKISSPHTVAVRQGRQSASNTSKGGVEALHLGTEIVSTAFRNYRHH